MFLTILSSGCPGSPGCQLGSSSWRPPSPLGERQDPLHSEPQDRVRGRRPRGCQPQPQPGSLVAMSYGGRNVTVGNPMPWAWPWGRGRGCVCSGSEGRRVEKEHQRPCSLALPGIQGRAEEGSPPSPGCASPLPQLTPLASLPLSSWVGLQHVAALPVLAPFFVPFLQGDFVNGTSQGPTSVFSPHRWPHPGVQ